MIEKKLKAKIVRHIRLLFRQSEQFRQAKELSVHPDIRGPRGGKMYQCIICFEAFNATEIQIDHLDPVVPKGTKQADMTIELYIERLYCKVSNLQVLCKECHKLKTKEERKK